MKLITKRIFALFLVCFLLLSAVGCSGNQTSESAASKITKSGSGILMAKTIKELCEESIYVVRGKVVELGNPYDVIVEGAPQVVRTDIFIETSEVFKGKDTKAGETVTCWALGGETDTMIMTTDSVMPKVGDEWFFFIWSDGCFYPYGKILEDGTVVIERFFVPEWYTETDNNFKYVPAEKVAELIRGYLGQTSTAG